MARLHAALGNWVQSKVDTDPNWQGRRIYLSGHNVANLLITFKLRFLKGFELLCFLFIDFECPGEGEHKIMDFIRAEKMQEGYDPNTRHCMYGLDADLVKLGIIFDEVCIDWFSRSCLECAPTSRISRCSERRSSLIGQSLRRTIPPKRKRKLLMLLKGFFHTVFFLNHVPKLADFGYF